MTPLEQLEQLETPPAPAPPVVSPEVPKRVDAAPPAACQTIVERLKDWADELGQTTLSIGLTSCSRGHGVSTIAISLADVATEMLDGEILLVDGHRSRASLDRTLKIARSPGVGDYLGGMASLPDCLADGRHERLKLMPAGAPGTIGPEESRSVETMFAALRRRFGWIVLDLPPVSEMGACLPLVRHLDGVLLVVAAGEVPAPVARRAVEQLRASGVRVLGVILNRCARALPWWLERRL